ncbi:MAG: adenylate/guanylate cyclase domain-containing protein [Cyanobacteria bacterium P01_E01_bin.45]
MFNSLQSLRDRLSRTPTRLTSKRNRRQFLTIGGINLAILLLWLANLPSTEDLLGLKPTWLWAAVQSSRHSLTLSRYEMGLMSLFTRLRGQTKPLQNVVLLEIDDEALNISDLLFPEELEETPILKAMGSWPWPRRVHARAVELLMEAGAEAVVFDIVFSQTSSYGPRDDRAFADVLERYGDRVALASLYPSNYVRGGQVDRASRPIRPFLESGAREGYANIVPDETNDVVYRLSSDFRPPDINLLATESVLALPEAALVAAGQPLPTRQGNWVYYYGPPGTIPHLSYSELMVPALREANLNENTFRNKIVLIGATAPTLQDFHATPWGRMPGPEIVLTNVLNLQLSQWLQTIPRFAQMLTILGIGLGGGWLVTRPTNTKYVVLATLAMTTAWLGVSYSLFLSGWAVTVTVWAGAALFLSGMADAVNIAIADRLGRLRMQTTLERYVSAPVAAEIISHQQEGLQDLFRGKSLQVSLLFSDIRGFTTISSQLPPEELVPQLNRYLGTMVEAITQHQGCVDKFIGDAVMAEFGSPVSSGHKQDAMNAIQAALAMRAALAVLREEWLADDKPLMFNGIGINFGNVVVGNIGSPQRLEYTAIGDAVNVASRVESLTKDYKTDLIVTQSVYDLVANEVDVNPLGARQLRGRSAETELYEVIGLKGDDRTLFDRVKADYAAHVARQSARKASDELTSGEPASDRSVSGESVDRDRKSQQQSSVPNAGIDVGVDNIQ